MASGGMTVKMTNKIPNRLKERELRAAARLSRSKSIAVAIADELAPRTTPQVTKSSDEVASQRKILNSKYETVKCHASLGHIDKARMKNMT